jgi:hypothetical protein
MPRNWLIIAILATVAACDGRIYLRDGVTDGNTFYLPQYVYFDEDPVLQSWVAYSLARSVCQLEIGGDNPARNHSFDCEATSRRLLVERWQELGGEPLELGPAPGPESDAGYLDALAAAAEAGYLDEYTWHYHRRRDWSQPAELRMAEFAAWRQAGLPSGHRPRTRIVGSWGYAGQQPAPSASVPSSE